jgi:hypothetical protein
MTFKQWLVTEGGKGSGTKFTGTGLGSGGMAQHGRVFRATSPHSFKIKTKIRRFSSYS